MIHAQNTKAVLVTPPAAAAEGGDATTAIIDTLGFDYLTIYVLFGVVDLGITALLLKEADTLTEGGLTGGGATVSGTTFGTSATIAGTTSALPDATESAYDDTVHRIDVDLKYRKRYLDLTVTAETAEESAGAFVTVLALLSRAEQAPVTAAQSGCTQILRV